MRRWQKYSTLALTTSMMMLATLGGNANLSFANSVDTKAPVIETVNTVTIDTVELVLKDEGGFDMLSLWDKSNYDIEGSTNVINVLTVDVDPSSGLATVVLKTDKFQKVEALDLYIRNIKDASGNAMGNTSYLIFTDLSPTVSTGYSYKDIIFYGSGKNEVTVIYNRLDALDISSIKNIQNYTSSELMFSTINVASDTSKNRAVVVLSTIENLIEGNQYHLFLNKLKLKGGTTCEPILKSDYISGFKTDSNKVTTNNQPVKSEDNKSPEVKRVRGKSTTSVEITLYDESGLDTNSLWDVSNYKIQDDYDIKEVTSVEKNNDGTTVTVVLKTSPIKTNRSQKIYLSNIKDTAGNELDARYYSFGPAPYTEEEKDDNKTSTSNDSTPPKIKMVKGKTPTSMELVFYDPSGFNMDTLKQKRNYDLQSTVEVQEIESVTLNASGDTATVILKTDKFTNSTSQKIQLSNIKDSLDNKIEEKEYSFGPVTE